ncbi:MAG: 2-phospho-L-lactate guanylyltransferase [Chloroflexi bacterium HGW-Chloroflexi-3]|nr:MAG: 2-phospho-L-lactate guanylyltransferase [Chloroflexi bacterium HGW-Chloroflexi-3]
MSLWVIIPVKPLRRSKSKLTNILSEEDRAILYLNLYENTLKALKQIKVPHQVLVVSKDSSVLSLARSYNAKTLQEDGDSGLNLALKKAIQVVKAYSAQSVLILPADLPFITKEDIEGVMEYSVEYSFMLISPDRKMSGTNLLFMSPPDMIDFSYGPGSFERHVRQAQAQNVHLEVRKFDSAELDIDSPEDFELYKKLINFEDKNQYLRI